MHRDFERLVGTDPDELLRLRFSRLKSVEICEKLLHEKCVKKGVSLDEATLREKSKGLSSAVDSGLNYWRIKEESLNTRVLSRYYALLQFTIAEEVASVDNNMDLKEAQKHTERGHGLSTLRKYTDNDFLENYFCYFRTDGHLHHYLQQIGFQKNEDFFVAKRLKMEDDLGGISVVSLLDLFRRIPELQNVVEEYTGKCPLVLNIGLDSMREHEKKELRREKYSKESGTFQFFAPEETDAEVTTYVSIYPTSENMTPEYVESLQTPFSNFRLAEDSPTRSEYIACDFRHANEGLWWNSIKTYKSSYSATSYIVPLFGKIDDPVVINYCLMYTLSIIVRYLPDIWYEITAGAMNNIGSLIDYYISVFDHTILLQMLQRITGKRVHVTSPGSLDAPI